ncbi:amidohydrolase family protein [Amycolatopsis magusensis]|uniref:Imidazolonepropionase-like amidohydrolase n=1 Tax=Amycolatopsis magusensis TaxID=882444 RepID=A0ABS4Q330_9PSEU|nr:amidohydrolase family protein [Amycolatopsis magusensis]MBP2186087.1 imidazolonepropionase-like amidohydrolase [Amycolatopsis magusensis]
MPTRRDFLKGGAAVAGGLLATAGTAPASTTPLVLTGATLIDGIGGRPRRDSTIVLAGDRIVAAGSVAAAGAQVIDLRGKFVIPGLWDMHVHTVPLDAIYPPLYVVNGVTGIREMYGYFHPQLPELRERVETGVVTGPRMVIASNLIDGPHSVHGPTGAVTVSTPEEARAAVRTMKEQGADFIKVYSMLTRETFTAVAEESRRVGLRFAGHVPERMSVLDAADAGQHSMEHLFGFFTATSTRETELRQRLAATPIDPANLQAWYTVARALEREAATTHDPRRARRLFDRLRRNGTYASPTLSVLRALSLPASGFDRDDPRLRYLPKSITDYWWLQVEHTGPATPAEIEEHRRFFDAELRMTGDLHRAGVPVLAGTDSNNAFCFPGFSLHDELALLVRAGLSPMHALQSATRDAARFLGRERTAGTVEPGKVADLVVLDEDPLADITNTSRIHAVVHRGRYLGPAERARLLAGIEKAAAEQQFPEPPVSGCGCRG